MNDAGIIAVQLDPDPPNSRLKILTLAGNAVEAVRQIAEIMGYPSSAPIDGRNLVYFPARRPEDAILLWRDVDAREKGMPVNFKVSGIAEARNVPIYTLGSIVGRAVLSGYDLESRDIRSVPLPTLAGHLSYKGDPKSARYIREWSEARGL